MPDTDVQTKPRMLLLALGAPDPTGSLRQARAWQLLRSAIQTHEVDLVILGADRLHMNHWRRLHALSPNLSLDYEIPHGTAAVRWAQSRNQLDYDLILCADAALWHLVAPLQARRAWCDLFIPAITQLEYLNADENKSLRNWWSEQQLQQRLNLERRAANQSDVILVNHSQSVSAFRMLGDALRVLPDQADAQAFAPGNADALLASKPDPDLGNASAPRIFLHIDRSLAAGHQQRLWFLQRLWPEIRRVVPHAQWVCTDGRDGRHPRGLRSRPDGQAPAADHRLRIGPGDAVVCPGQEPAFTAPLVRQALAAGAAVIASAPAVRGLPLISGCHLLIAHNTGQWIDGCTTLIRGAALRKHLSQQALQWAAQFDLTGQPLPFTPPPPALSPAADSDSRPAPAATPQPQPDRELAQVVMGLSRDRMARAA
jgi:hypothetical protein